jgi:hypothetical protein
MAYHPTRIEDQEPRMKFAKNVFLIAGVYGLLVTFPLYFMEQRMGMDHPPPINHPEYYYSFIGVTVVFPILFFFIAGDPVRYRPLMFLCVLEKMSLVPTFFILFPQGRYPVLGIPLVVIDLAFGILFAVVYIKTKGPPKHPTVTGG